MEPQNAPEKVESAPDWKRWLRGLFSILLTIGMLAGLLFLAAGRIDWPAAWLLITLYALYLLAFGIWGIRKAPELLQERSRVSANVKTWDKWINIIYTLLLVSLFVIAGFDVMRYQWSSMSPVLQILGTAGLSFAGGVIWWTIVENAYASRWARIQADRGQVVISSGPYRYIRHPMYAAIILLMPCVSLELGSWWGLVPAGLIAALFIIRTLFEDRMLQDELPGYGEYANRVRYRLLPGVW